MKLVTGGYEGRCLYSEEIPNLKQDLKDLGKFRIIKQGKEFFGEGGLEFNSLKK